MYVDGNLTDNCSLVDGEYSFTFANPLTVGEHIVTVKYLENENFTEASANYSGPKWAFVDLFVVLLFVVALLLLSILLFWIFELLFELKPFLPDL